MGAVFFNKGENCIAAGRLFVEDSIHDKFIEKVVSASLKVKFFLSDLSYEIIVGNNTAGLIDNVKFFCFS